MGLNTYMYAPKDDYKHRAYWRELYSVEEAGMYINLLQNGVKLMLLKDLKTELTKEYFICNLNEYKCL